MKFTDIKDSKNLKIYLKSPFSNTSAWNRASHYTNLDTLHNILKSKKLRFSSMKRMNDVFELEFAKNCKDYFFCLSKITKSKKENFGMWAMYGHIRENCTDNETSEEKSKKIGVKIEFPKEVIENFQNTHEGLSVHFVAYGDRMFKKSKNITVGSSTNRNAISLMLKDFYGYLKDIAWDYENELRIRLSYDSLTEEEKKQGFADRTIDTELLKLLTVFPSPTSDVEECKKILKDLDENRDLDEIKFKTNDFEDMFNGNGGKK